jgi:hypothetical protein
MIKLLRDYKHHKKGDTVDLGCVMNRRLIDVGWAISLKVFKDQIKVK